MKNLSFEALSPSELVEIVLGSSLLPETVAESADAARSPKPAIEYVRDPWSATSISDEKRNALFALHHLMRASWGASPASKPDVRGAGDVYRHLSRFRADHVERFYLLALNGRHQLIETIEISSGTTTSALVHPRIVFRAALSSGAVAVVVAHNHPSGDPTPSREDVAITRRLMEAGTLLGCELLDHVVIGDPGFVSMRERGLIEPPKSLADADAT